MEVLTSTEGLFYQDQSETLLNEKSDPISLKQAGHVASTSHLDTDMPNPGKKAFVSPSVTIDVASDDGMSPGGMMETGAGGCVLYKDAKPKGIRMALSKELLLSVSPDSGTEMTVPAERDRVEMEPVGVSRAREAAAMLGAAKQRLEAQHRGLEKMLKENRASIAEVREVSVQMCMGIALGCPKLPSLLIALLNFIWESLKQSSQ